MHKLGDLLNLTQPPDATLLYQPVVILNVGAEHIALVVDQLLTGREIVVKSLGNHLRRIHGIMGATLMGDGSVVLIVNPVELLSTPTSLEFQPDPVRETPTSVDNGSLQIMVVDDSLSVRTVVSNLVRSVGWEPVAVRDGLEALEHLQQAGDQPDLILVDIEMPRMDGYELMSTLKANTAFEDIPLVVLSSRAGPKHRQRAMEIGAADYIVKPYKDAEMIDIIQRLVRESSGVMSE
jgi:chemosensory pili system protein ChpA (sensor histidine kinase/response regulator)